MQFIINELERNLKVFKGLLSNIDKDLYLWRLTPEKWCLLEIVCHLYDEERLDFRFRTQWVLEKPNKVPPPFNPMIWVDEHDYMSQNFASMCEKFYSEREFSINWLKKLENPNWNNAFEHSKLGAMTAEYFLNNWLAHDYLHIRQIIKLKFDYFNHSVSSDLNYAGTW